MDVGPRQLCPGAGSAVISLRSRLRGCLIAVSRRRVVQSPRRAGTNCPICVESKPRRPTRSKHGSIHSYRRSMACLDQPPLERMQRPANRAAKAVQRWQRRMERVNRLGMRRTAQTSNQMETSISATRTGGPNTSGSCFEPVLLRRRFIPPATSARPSPTTIEKRPTR